MRRRSGPGLKFFNVYGPNEEHKGPMKSVAAQIWPDVAARPSGAAVQVRTAPDVADGGQLRDFVYVRDVADVVAWLASRPDGERGVQPRLAAGRARSRTWPRRCSAPPARAPQIDYVRCRAAIARPLPVLHRGRASIGCARAGYEGQFTSLEDGIADYVSGYPRRPPTPIAVTELTTTSAASPAAGRRA